ncbi:esterase/lipase family protein [Saccharothrix australiensis]|uniref:Lipase (Class 2) n=1 Tax=Saccharothrix australiensis TaxID=2072 RepID=A0A495VZ59_9PSEU|nr:alpha/beta fold hydrolase [Saccharothrix australiensis]RKT54499.1 lipase (class 2) [Saccharothrix australiensis]
MWRLLVVSVLVPLLLWSSGVSAASGVLVGRSGAAALANAALRPDTPPDGANDWSCAPSPAHPRPVVLVHGTVENMTYNWFALAPLLADEGYCVFAFNYGQRPGRVVGLPGSRLAGGVAPIAESAAELAAFVDEVRYRTGAAEVDLVGHSQGGLMPRHYLKFLGGAAAVHHLVALAPPNHGTTVLGLSRLPGVPELLAAGLGESVADQVVGSDFLRALNAGGDTVPGVRYTVIATRYDEVVTPYTSAFLDGPEVTNITLQRLCGPAHASEHLAVPFDQAALRHVLNALDPAHARPVACGLALPVVGG